MTTNLNQNKHQIDEYCYVEILDTIGLNRVVESIKLHKFYENFLKNEVIFCKKNINFPDEFSTLLKYEYFKNADQAIFIKGLFSLERIMAYLFVFDYSLTSSFDEVFTYANELFNIHSNKFADKSERSLFYFLGNMYDNPIELDNIDEIYSIDPNYKYYLSKISQIYENTSEGCKFLKYISSKFNFNINETFIDILGNIGQNELLYNKLQYDNNDKIESKESNSVKNENNILYKIFYKCCRRNENRYDEYYNFTETEESNYDNNEIIIIQQEANINPDKQTIDTDEIANEISTSETKEVSNTSKNSNMQVKNEKCIIM